VPYVNRVGGVWEGSEKCEQKKGKRMKMENETKNLRGMRTKTKRGGQEEGIGDSGNG
jgi:hypothetical protein